MIFSGITEFFGSWHTETYPHSQNTKILVIFGGIWHLWCLRKAFGEKLQGRIDRARQDLLRAIIDCIGVGPEANHGQVYGNMKYFLAVFCIFCGQGRDLEKRCRVKSIELVKIYLGHYWLHWSRLRGESNAKILESYTRISYVFPH